MEIHPDAPANPLFDELTELVDAERILPTDFRRAGKLRHVDISEHNERIVNESLLDLQNTCLPTLNQLRSERNISQLQERVYHKLLPHIDALNICILRSRTALQADYCFQKYQADFNGPFKANLKDLLLEY
jgi:hypothetical protein